MNISPKGNADLSAFERYDAMNWSLELEDSGSGNWQDHWVLDGERADIRNTPGGMVFSGGPVAYDDGSHAVLWTKKSFSGSMKVEFDFTRLDTINRFVNILYFQATGIGGQYAEDIHSWRHLREIPSMRTYFTYMNLLHISYAAFGNDNDDDDNYLRVRRYPINEQRGFGQTQVDPSIENTGFFQSGVLHRMCFVKTPTAFAVRVIRGNDALCQVWDLSGVEPLPPGPLGIRHMFTKCSRYQNIRIFTGH